MHLRGWPLLVVDALVDERLELTERASTAGRIFTIPDISKRVSVYAPIDESGSVTDASTTN